MDFEFIEESYNAGFIMLGEKYSNNIYLSHSAKEVLLNGNIIDIDEFEDYINKVYNYYNGQCKDNLDEQHVFNLGSAKNKQWIIQTNLTHIQMNFYNKSQLISSITFDFHKYEVNCDVFIREMNKLISWLKSYLIRVLKQTLSRLEQAKPTT